MGSLFEFRRYLSTSCRKKKVAGKVSSGYRKWGSFMIDICCSSNISRLLRRGLNGSVTIGTPVGSFGKTALVNATSRPCRNCASKLEDKQTLEERRKKKKRKKKKLSGMVR
jgi:hypothetical protein